MERYPAMDAPVSTLNDSVHESRRRSGQVPWQLQRGQSQTVLLECCNLSRPFHVHMKAHGGQAALPAAILEVNNAAKRFFTEHFRNHHPSDARKVIQRAKRNRKRARSSPVLRDQPGCDGPVIVDEEDDDDDYVSPAAKRLRQTDAAAAPVQEVPPAAAAVGAAPVAPVHPVPQRHAEQQQQQHAAPTTLATLVQPPRIAGPLAPRRDGAPPAGAVIMVEPAFVNLAHQPVQLPCMVQMEWFHPKYGPHQATALLLWVDQHGRVQDSAKELGKLATTHDEYFVSLPPVGHDRNDTVLRGLYLHKIVHITPAWSPVAHLVGKMFSSPFASYAHLTESRYGQTKPLLAWHLLHQPHVTLAVVMSQQGFFPPDISNALTSTAELRDAQLLADQTNSREQPLLRMTMIEAPIRVIRRRVYTPCFSDPAEQALWTAGKLREDQAKSLRWIETSQFIEEEEEPPPMQMPRWVADSPIASFRNHFQEAGEEYALRDVTLRDLAAAMCVLECNERECAPSDDAKGGSSHVCRHGTQHRPYLAPAVAASRCADKTNASAKKSSHKISAEDRKKFDSLGSLFFLPSESDVDLLRRHGAPVARSSWAGRIQFHDLLFKQQVETTRRLGDVLLDRVQQALVSDHPRYGDGLHALCTALEHERRIDTPDKLDAQMRHGVWKPEIISGRPWHGQPTMNADGTPKMCNYPTRWVMAAGIGQQRGSAVVLREIERPISVAMFALLYERVRPQLFPAPLR